MVVIETERKAKSPTAPDYLVARETIMLWRFERIAEVRGLAEAPPNAAIVSALC